MGFWVNCGRGSWWKRSLLYSPPWCLEGCSDPGRWAGPQREIHVLFLPRWGEGMAELFFLLRPFLRCLRLKITVTPAWGCHWGWYVLVLFGGLLQICIHAFPVHRDREACCVGVSHKMNKTPLHKDYARDFGVGKGEKIGNTWLSATEDGSTNSSGSPQFPLQLVTEDTESELCFLAWLTRARAQHGPCPHRRVCSVRASPPWNHSGVRTAVL